MNNKNLDLAKVIYASIKETKMPWRKTWHNGAVTRPYNPITKTLYRGTNALMLYLPIMIKIMSSEEVIPEYRYSTFNQIKKAGLSLKKGCHGFPVFFYSQYVKEDKNGIEDPEVRGFLKRFTVFNYEDIEFTENSKIPKMEVNEFECEIPNIKRIIDNLQIKILEGNTLIPCYHIKKNLIMLPTNFEDDISKYTTLFHEIVHWTKNNIDKCKRELNCAQEELVAELGSFMICHDLGLEYTPSEINNYYSYLDSWLSSYLTEDEKLNALNDCLIYANRATKAILNALN